MKLSIIVPCYNEEKTIEEIIKKIKNIKFIKKEIIIIDDYSTDRTKKILEKIDNHEIKVLYNELNYGKGYSVRKGIKFSSGDIIIIQDADLEYDPEDINKLLEIAITEKKDFVIGHRLMKTTIKHPYFYFRELAVNSLTLLLNILYGTSIKDCACCYRLFTSDLWKNIDGKADEFEYDFSIICQAVKKTKNIGQCSVYYMSRTYEEGKKCTWDVGIHAFKRIILDRF